MIANDACRQCTMPPTTCQVAGAALPAVRCRGGAPIANIAGLHQVLSQVKREGSGLEAHGMSTGGLLQQGGTARGDAHDVGADENAANTALLSDY